jgi:pSer/pThr/pTyr-binding forkhead associated (FHA) protein
MLKLQYRDQRKPAIWLVEQRYSIGKDAQNTIVLPEDTVSPFHAEIRVEGDQVFLSDTGSTAGTFVNGKRIARRTELRAGDVITVGKTDFGLVDPKQEIAPAPEGATAITPALANIPIAQVAANKAGSGWSLKAKTGSIVGKTFPIPGMGKVVVGRANNCDIQLPANHVSRQHAEVQVVGGKLIVRDLNSANGTYINRKKISEGEAKAGDEVRFDTFSFDVAGPAAAGGAAAGGDEDGEERTQFRPAAPANTGVRPRTDAPAAKPAAAAKPAGKPASVTATTTFSPRVESGSDGGGSKTMLVVVILVVLAAAAGGYFFFAG